jgi:hypothetical protein
VSALGAAGASRRGFLAGAGVLVLNFSILPRLATAQGAPGGNAAAKTPALPGSLQDAPMLDSWIRIDADGSITVFTGKVEFGQGIKTALIQVAAEELVVEPRRIALVTADTSLTPNEGYTAGSQSMQLSGTAILNAAAQVRVMLVELAAARFNVAADQLIVRDGVVRAADGRSLSYGELVSAQALHVSARPESMRRDPATHTVIGRPLQRTDIPAKLTGAASYVQDLRLPGMVHARMLRPPSYGARLRTLDTGQVERLPGVLKVVRDGDFVALIAAREYQVVSAGRALAKAAAWDERPSLPAQSDLYAYIRRLPSKDTVILGSEAASSFGAGAIEASYRRPYQMHASIGPSCAVGLLQDRMLTIWTHSQGVYPLRKAIAEMLRRPKRACAASTWRARAATVTMPPTTLQPMPLIASAFLAGRYGCTGCASRSMRGNRGRGDGLEPPGQARRERQHRPLAIRGMEQYAFSRPGRAGDLLAATHLQTPFAPPPPQAIPQPAAAATATPSRITRFPTRASHHFVPAMPLRVSSCARSALYECVLDRELHGRASAGRRGRSGGVPLAPS